MMYTYAPFMHRLFDSRPVALEDGLLVLATGGALLVVLEIERYLRRIILGIVGKKRTTAPQHQVES
tara:strand:+ start:283 stop:480 length:198 start_codon:yes stop_codon:yes gene_type:complete